MVAKISVSNSLYGAIVYNGEKINKEHGRLLDTNKIYNDGTESVDIKRAFADFMQWIPSTTKTERPMVHISLNPHPTANGFAAIDTPTPAPALNGCKVVFLTSPVIGMIELIY